MKLLPAGKRTAGESLMSQDAVWFICEGPDTLATVTINGSVAGKTTAGRN